MTKQRVCVRKISLVSKLHYKSDQIVFKPRIFLSLSYYRENAAFFLGRKKRSQDQCTTKILLKTGILSYSVFLFLVLDTSSFTNFIEKYPLLFSTM